MGSSRKVVLAGLGLALLVGVLWGPDLLSEREAGAPTARGSGVEAEERPDGYGAPDFSVTTFEGESFSLAAQKGTPVVLNFWESW